MRIRELEIPAYGLFTDCTFQEIPEGLVVIPGANEEGKSTLFSLLTTLLYGFHPVSDFPYRPWHVDRYPELRAVLSLEDGSSAEVRRKLTSTPAGNLTRGDHATDLGNYDLPFVQHVSRDLYRALYALTQVNMRSLEDAQRQEVEDRLLAGLGAHLLRSTREVVAELENRAQKQWRPDRRGKPRYSELQKECREARRRRDDAKERDEGIRAKAKRLQEVQQELEELEQSLARLNGQIRRADVLVPVRKKLRQIENWRSQLPDISAIEQLPEGLISEHQRLSERVQNTKTNVENLERDRLALVKVQESFTDENRAMLASSDRVEAWVRRMSGHDQEQRTLADLERKEQRLRDSVVNTAGSLLAGPWKEEHATQLEEIALPELKGRIDRYQETQTEVQRLQGAAENMSPVRVVGDIPRGLTIGVTVAGLILFVLGLVVSITPVWIAGLVAAMIGGAATAFSLYIRHERAVREDERRQEIERLKKREHNAREARDKARERVEEAVCGLPVAQALLERPDLTLYQAVDRLRSLFREKHQVSDDLEGRQKSLEGARKDLQELLEELGEQEATQEAVSRVEQKLRSARECHHEYEDATTRIEQIDGALEPASKASSEARKAYDEFMARVAQVAGEELEIKDALDRAADLQATARRVREAEQQLENDYPDLNEIRAEIPRLESSEEDTWVLDPEQVELSRKKSEALNEEWKKLTEERISLSKDIDNARGDVSVGELDGDIDRLEEEMRDLCRDHDRLVLMTSVLREADRRFREKHQPDVLRRASEYLQRITDGRYRRLITLESAEGGERLAVITESGEPRNVEFPLSGGTLDQIYLAFRLAVIDHLDEGHESLPLILDEALVNWDDVRFEKTMQLLSEVASRRQVFLFTCHHWMSDRLLKLPGASTVSLGSS
jgi:uncharacterized protein YhaN